MSEFLTVRLSRKANAPISWLVWSTSQNDVIASGELSSKAQLEDLLPYAEQRTTLVLIDSRDVILREAEVPSGASRQLENMLPYLMEEDIAQDVDELHFSILKHSSNRVHVAAMDRRYLKECLSTFSQIGIEVKKVLPDVLAMPNLDNGVSALQIDDTWLFRKNLFEGMVADQNWLSLFLASQWCKSDESPLPITAYTSVPKECLGKELKLEQEWKTAEAELVMGLLTKGAIVSSVNLLTGKFKPQSSILKHIKTWKKVAIAAGIFLALLTTQRVLQVNQYEVEASAFRIESEKIFRTVFPDKRKIPTVSYLKRQMNDEVNRLSGGAGGESLIDWLSEIPQAVAKHPSVEIQSIRYDAKRGEVRIETFMKDFQTFEVIRTKLAEKFTVVQGPLNKKNDKVSGSFVLRRKQ